MLTRILQSVALPARPARLLLLALLALPLALWAAPALAQDIGGDEGGDPGPPPPPWEGEDPDPIDADPEATIGIGVPVIFRVTYALAPSPTLSVSQAMVLNNNGANVYGPVTGGSFVYSTNVPSSHFKVKREPWLYAPPNSNSFVAATGYGDFGLRLSVALAAAPGAGSGYVVAPFNTSQGGHISTATANVFIEVPGGDALRSATLNYNLDGLDLTDQAGAYKSTVSFTMYTP